MQVLCQLTKFQRKNIEFSKEKKTGIIILTNVLLKLWKIDLF